MARWTCPECQRRFGKRGQSHVCAPLASLDDYLKERSPAQREVCERVIAHLEDMGEVDVEAASVGVLIKRSCTFVELRPRRDGMALSMRHSRDIDHPRIARRIKASAHRIFHFVNLRSPDEVDDEVLEWLAESYLDAEV